MKNNYLRYEISIASEEQKDVLLALLAEWGIEGFEEQENRLFASGKEAEIDRKSIEHYLLTNDLTYSLSTIEDRNWNAVWESNFEPVQVEDFVGIRADFHEPIRNVEHEIVITPKMSFGTGHHATTWLVLKCMKDLPLKDAAVFDFGTGTGILAIMAEKLGARSVLAVDYDDWCIENAGENIDRNNCNLIRLEKADSADRQELFDIVLANINKNVILGNLNFMDKMLMDGGHLILSGLLTDDRQDVLNELPNEHFRLSKILEKNGWIAIHLQKQ